MDRTNWLRVDIFKFASILRQFLQEYIHELQNVPKTVAMWALSLLQVVLLCHYSAPTLESRKWRNRLQFLIFNPSRYSFPFFQNQCAVYVKLPFHAPEPMWNFQFGIGVPVEILIFIIPLFWKLLPHMTCLVSRTSRVRSLISKALQFQNATVPRKNPPFSLPFLAHSDFKQQVQFWLRQVVIRSKELAIPFFLPTHQIREAAHPTLRKFLHNHRRAERRWMTSNIDSLPCCCEELHKMMTCSTSGLQHLAVNLEDLRLPAKLNLFQHVNANSTYFAAKSPYFELTIGAFRRWLKDHGLRAE